MRVQHNIMAMSAYRNYTNNVNAMKKNLEKLSSGYKINRAGDDAAGLAISEKMRAQITGLSQAQANAKSGINLVQTAEGALTEVHDMLNRMVKLADQSANGTYDNAIDRNQMQKEVDQLLSEINRIADSSNFNGINLLDGTLGLNTDAFNISAGNAYTADVAAQTSNVTLASTDYHGGQAVQQVGPKFTIDLHDIEIVNTGNASATMSFKVQVAGATFTFTGTDQVAAGSKMTAAQIAGAIADGIGSGANAAANGFATIGSSSIVAVTIGGLKFTAAAAGNTGLTFTYAGVGSKVDKAAASQASLITDALASTFNAAIGAAVTVTATDANTGITGQEGKYICAIEGPKNAVAKKTAQRPGVDIDLANILANGKKLTIADGTGSSANKTTYVFKTDKNSNVTAGAGETLIDVSMHASADQAKMAALIVAGGAETKVVNGATVPTGNAKGSVQTAAGGMYQVSVKSGTVIHFDVAAAANASKADTKEKMEKLISVTTPAQAAKAASTKLTVTASAIQDGDTLKIGEGTAAKTYTFKAGDTLADVKAAISADFDVASSTGTGELLISVKNATATTAAPSILGKGLTLQIGDTSDSFNQLNVAVQDMHANSLGIGGLDISTESAAQAAVDKIKAAINTVSDVRGTLGATQNRLDHTINNLSVMQENIQDAESTIRDTDVAEEMMAYTKNNILIQSAQAMLAQANQVPQGVLQLLQ